MIVFRCDANPSLGFGHLSRCRALAMALRERGVQCSMMGPPLEYVTSSDKVLFSEWIPIGEWTSSLTDASRLLALVHKLKSAIVVLDDYRIDEAYQKTLTPKHIRWLQFDGSAKKKLWAEWVLNSNPTANSIDYAKIICNPRTTLLMGARYAILRPEFTTTPSQPANRPLKRVLISMGGGDDRGGIIFTLSSLLPHTPPDVRFLIVSGGANPRNTEIARWIDTNAPTRAELHVAPADIATIFASCDLAIMAAGTSTYEAACCNVPMLLIAIADNQIRHALAWQSLGAALYLGELGQFTQAEVLTTFEKLHRSAIIRHTLSERAASVCDGRGADRVADILHSALSFRKQ